MHRLRFCRPSESTKSSPQSNLAPIALSCDLSVGQARDPFVAVVRLDVIFSHLATVDSSGHHISHKLKIIKSKLPTLIKTFLNPLKKKSQVLTLRYNLERHQWALDT